MQISNPLICKFSSSRGDSFERKFPATISKSAQIFTIHRSRLSVRLPCHVSFPFREESAYFIPRGVQTVFSASTSLRAPRLLSVPQFSTSPLQRLQRLVNPLFTSSFRSTPRNRIERSRKLKKKSLGNGFLDLTNIIYIISIYDDFFSIFF